MKKINFSVDDFLSFATSMQEEGWVTMTQKKKFSYKVTQEGIKLTPSTGEVRNISHQEINKFIRDFNIKQSFKTSDYTKSFNKSYLLAITKAYNKNNDSFKLPEEILHPQSFEEGETKKIYVNSHERNSKARKECINHHGSRCFACKVSFKEIYGNYAEGFIHVHHIKPLSEVKKRKIINPKTDLIPICPNCHAVIHLRGRCLSIEKLVELIESARSSRYR
ncbi:HNH endonuclease [Microbulbifer sp. VTAC004]|uniref:HNH endonuclease n=1 Tax=Microbulbifer TaxID=48073 RepID=UPI00037F92CF|nr:HNH endonuclease [Microbulbifer variabilis]